ncbi:MAG: formate--tetrahydrofolate ligase, partial [Methylobacterium sp.]
MPSDIEIARAATLKPIAQVAEKLGIPDDALHNYG